MTAGVGTPTMSEASDPSSQLKRFLPVGLMILFTVSGALLPTLWTPGFYFWDDTAAAAAGTWERIARDILHGQTPFLQLDMWRGGNLAAEAATGMWNPVMVGLMILIYPIDNLAVAFTLAKILLLVLTATGVYFLARSYSANPWLAAAAGTAFSLSGWVIFLDGTSWINGTAVTALIPWGWWLTRRAFLKGFTPGAIVLAVLSGYLVGSTGNPYSAIALAVAYGSVAVEAIAQKRWRDTLWLVGLGLSTLLLILVAYLPFVYTSRYGVRAESGMWNDEFLAVSLSDLLGMSSPTHHPYITMFSGTPMGVPGTYLAWFVLPLTPWLKWSALRDRWRELSSALAFGALYLILVLGPSQIWLFRWPARLIPFLYLAVIVTFASVASAGLHRDNRRRRVILTGAAVFTGAWLAFSDAPGPWRLDVLVAVLIMVGTLAIARWGRKGVVGFLVMATGCNLALVSQLALQPINANVANYQLPASKQALRSEFADQSDGVMVQIFDVGLLLQSRAPERAWQSFLIGNMTSVAGLNSTTAYTGIGFTKFDVAMCSTYNGASCDQAWDHLWEVPRGADRPLADLIRAKYVVVENGYLPSPVAPPGWEVSTKTDVATVFSRKTPIPNTTGTISAWGDSVEISSDVLSGGVAESGVVTTGSGQTTVTFARIAWPGYALTVDGEPVRTSIGPAGLLTAALPAGLHSAHFELTFRTPGLRLGGALAGLGALILVGLVVLAARRNRRPQPMKQAASTPREDEPSD